jgi:hypothetical protein
MLARLSEKQLKLISPFIPLNIGAWVKVCPTFDIDVL